MRPFSQASMGAIATAGLLDTSSVSNLFDRYHASNTSVADQVQLDALINHLLSVQILHEQFIAADIPTMAQERARELEWSVSSR